MTSRVAELDFKHKYVKGLGRIFKVSKMSGKDMLQVTAETDTCICGYTGSDMAYTPAAPLVTPHGPSSNARIKSQG